LILINQGDRVVLAQQNYHQRGVTIMAQGVLPFKYEKEKTNTGMTALAGLPVYLDLAKVIGLSKSIEKHLKVRKADRAGLTTRLCFPLYC
jgi:hypothetical protein